MHSLGTSANPFVSSTESNKDVGSYKNLDSSKQSDDDFFANIGSDQDIFSLSHMKHVAPSSNISEMVEPSPLNSNQSSAIFSSEETKPLLSDTKEEQRKQESVKPFYKETETNDKGEFSSIIDNLSSSNIDSDKKNDTISDKPLNDRLNDSLNDSLKDSTIIDSSNSGLTSTTTNPSTTTKDLQTVAKGEGADKTLKEVGQVIQNQAQTLATSLRNNVNRDNMPYIIVDSVLVLIIAILLYLGIW